MGHIAVCPVTMKSSEVPFHLAFSTLLFKLDPYLISALSTLTFNTGCAHEALKTGLRAS